MYHAPGTTPSGQTLSDVSLAILTWRAPQTLAHTLKHLVPLLERVSDRVIVCQESDPEEIAIAESFDFRVVALESNVGIQHGMKQAVEACRHEQVLFIENDVVLRQPIDVTVNVLSRLQAMLEAREIEFAKLRLLPLELRRKVARYWAVRNGHPVRRPYGWLRFAAANDVASDVVCGELRPGFASRYLADRGDGIYATNSKYCRWENLAVLMNRAFFLDTLIPFAEANPTSRTVNGFPDLEHRINTMPNRRWWRGQRFGAAIVKPGLFGHRRLDRIAADEKWQMVNPIDEGGPVEVYEPRSTDHHSRSSAG
jgi:hypothetical protein